MAPSSDSSVEEGRGTKRPRGQSISGSSTFAPSKRPRLEGTRAFRTENDIRPSATPASGSRSSLGKTRKVHRTNTEKERQVTDFADNSHLRTASSSTSKPKPEKTWEKKEIKVPVSAPPKPSQPRQFTTAATSISVGGSRQKPSKQDDVIVLSSDDELATLPKNSAVKKGKAKPKETKSKDAEIIDISSDSSPKAKKTFSSAKAKPSTSTDPDILEISSGSDTRPRNLDKRKNRVKPTSAQEIIELLDSDDEPPQKSSTQPAGSVSAPPPPQADPAPPRPPTPEPDPLDVMDVDDDPLFLPPSSPVAVPPTIESNVPADSSPKSSGPRTVFSSLFPSPKLQLDSQPIVTGPATPRRTPPRSPSSSPEPLNLLPSPRTNNKPTSSKTPSPQSKTSLSPAVSRASHPATPRPVITPSLPQLPSTLLQTASPLKSPLQSPSPLSPQPSLPRLKSGVSSGTESAAEGSVTSAIGQLSLQNIPSKASVEDRALSDSESSVEEVPPPIDMSTQDSQLIPRPLTTNLVQRTRALPERHATLSSSDSSSESASSESKKLRAKRTPRATLPSLPKPSRSPIYSQTARKSSGMTRLRPQATTSKSDPPKIDFRSMPQTSKTVVVPEYASTSSTSRPKVQKPSSFAGTAGGWNSDRASSASSSKPQSTISNSSGGSGPDAFKRPTTPISVTSSNSRTSRLSQSTSYLSLAEAINEGARLNSSKKRPVSRTPNPTQKDRSASIPSSASESRLRPSEADTSIPLEPADVNPTVAAPSLSLDVLPSDDTEAYYKTQEQHADYLHDLLEGLIPIAGPQEPPASAPLATPLTGLAEATAQLSLMPEPPSVIPHDAPFERAADPSESEQLLPPAQELRAVSPLEYMSDDEAEKLLREQALRQAQPQPPVQPPIDTTTMEVAESVSPAEPSTSPVVRGPRGRPRKLPDSALREEEKEDEEDEDDPIVRRTRLGRKTRASRIASPETGPAQARLAPRRSSRASGLPSSKSRSASSDGSAVSRGSSAVTAEESPETSPEAEDRIRTFDGIKILSFKNVRDAVMQQGIKCFWAKDIDTTFYDGINRMSEHTRNMLGMRELLKGYIREHTSNHDDEPDAPQIDIVNDVDAAATPPWEFFYSNRMWFGEGLEAPNIKDLVGCDCVGKCNPRSKTCACVRRQLNMGFDHIGSDFGFAYNPQKRLKRAEIPIVECNMLCQCDETCQNRVVQAGRRVALRLQKTKTKGWGVFASQKIQQGTFIGIYSGELLLEEEGTRRGRDYNRLGRTYLFDIDFWYFKILQEKGVIPTREESPVKTPAKQQNEGAGEEDSDDENSYANKYTVDAFHVGNFTRFLNHSCDPNCHLNACYINDPDVERPLLTLFTAREIQKDEELTFSYSGVPDEEDDPKQRKKSPDTKKDAIYAPCYCGAAKCKGILFS